jgi:hypothetical protein
MNSLNTRIDVCISFTEFVEYPPYMALYLISVKLIEHGIPIILNLTDIMDSPKIESGTLKCYEDFNNGTLVYRWVGT